MDDDHVDLEQGPPEYSPADQMRLRRQSIRVVAVRTLLLTMVPFGAMVVLSVYFRLISLDKVISALFVTYAIAAVLLLYAHLIWIDYTDDTQDDINLAYGLTFVFYTVLAVTAYLPFCTFPIFPHDQSIDAMVLQVLLSIFAVNQSMLMAFLFHGMVMFAQWTFGGRSDPIEFGDNGAAVRRLSQVFASIITCMYMCELANIAIVQTVIPWIAIDITVLVEVVMKGLHMKA